MHTARDHQAWNLLLAQSPKPFHPNAWRQTLKIGAFGGAKNLNPFLGEIAVKAGKRQSRPVNRRFANLAMKSNLRPLQLHLQLFSVRLVEALYCHHRHTFSEITGGRDGLAVTGAAFWRHWRLTLNPNRPGFPTGVPRPVA